MLYIYTFHLLGSMRASGRQKSQSSQSGGVWCSEDFNHGCSHVRNPTGTILNIVVQVACTELRFTPHLFENRTERVHTRGVVIVVSSTQVFAT